MDVRPESLENVVEEHACVQFCTCTLVRERANPPHIVGDFSASLWPFALNAA
jgi:hypothetical protein